MRTSPWIIRLLPFCFHNNYRPRKGQFYNFSIVFFSTFFNFYQKLLFYLEFWVQSKKRTILKNFWLFSRTTLPNLGFWVESKSQVGLNGDNLRLLAIMLMGSYQKMHSHIWDFWFILKNGLWKFLLHTRTMSEFFDTKVYGP